MVCKLKKCDRIVTIFVFIFFFLVFVLNYFNQAILESLNFRPCVLLMNAFSGPKLYTF